MRGEMMNRRPTTLFALLILLAIAFFMANIGAGEYELSLWEVVQTLFGLGSGEHSFIVNTLRLPRALIAFLVGAGLAVSGAILQGITSNPLASPGVIGLNAGASLAAVLVIVALPAVPLGFCRLPPLQERCSRRFSPTGSAGRRGARCTGSFWSEWASPQSRKPLLRSS